MSQKLRDMNKEAEVVNAKLIEYADANAQQTRNTTQMPVFEETRQRTQRCLDRISAMVKPTLEGLSNQRTKIEIMERVYRRLSRPLAEMESCMAGALDHHDALVCQNTLVNTYEGVFPAIEGILREY